MSIFIEYILQKQHLLKKAKLITCCYKLENTDNDDEPQASRTRTTTNDCPP